MRATIANYDLSVDDPSWHCDTLHNAVDSLRGVYYSARILRHLEQAP